VTKMSRIIAHVGSGTEQGAQILSSIQARTHPPAAGNGGDRELWCKESQDRHSPVTYPCAGAHQHENHGCLSSLDDIWPPLANQYVIYQPGLYAQAL